MSLSRSDAQFESLLAEGLALGFEAYWGAGLLRHRYQPGATSWS